MLNVQINETNKTYIFQSFQPLSSNNLKVAQKVKGKITHPK